MSKPQIGYILACHPRSGTPTWQLCPHYFHLVSTSPNVIGQYITSDWYSDVLVPGEKRYLLVVGVKRGQYFSEIEKVINREKTMGAPLSEEEMSKGLVFKDYYILTCPGSMKGTSDHQRLDGESGHSYLTLRLHRHMEPKEGENKVIPIYVSTPNLTIYKIIN